jgi:hypothetical protein
VWDDGSLKHGALLWLGCALCACGRIGFDPSARIGNEGADAGSLGAIDAASGAAIDAAATDLLDAGATTDAAVPPCKFSCSYDYVGSSTNCGSGAITFQLLSPGDPSVLRVDMAGMVSLEATITVCDPVGPVFQIADSASNGLEKGDSGLTSNDAHLLLRGTAMQFFPNDYGGDGGQSKADYVPAVGCSQRTIVVADQTIETLDLSVNDPTALRLDPPIDDQGTPDRLWYLGINRTVDTSATDEGSGLADMNFCLR